MSQSMLIPGHRLCDANSYCRKRGAGREKRVESETGMRENKPGHVWGACAPQFITTIHLSGGVTCFLQGASKAEIAKGEAVISCRRLHLFSISWLNQKLLFPSTYQFVMSRKQYFSTQSTWNVSNSNFFFFNERQFEMLIFSFKFLTLCSRTSPPKQLLTFQKYLAGVSSHGVNRVTWVGVKNLSDPSLHRV